MPVIVRGTVLLVFVNTVASVDDVPTCTVPNARGEGLNETVAFPPVPVRLKVEEPPETLSLTLSVAVRVPVVAGVNVTVIVQVKPPNRVNPQVLVWAKSLELV